MKNLLLLPTNSLNLRLFSPLVIFSLCTNRLHFCCSSLIRRRSIQSMAATQTQDSPTADVNIFQLIQAHQEKAARLRAIEEVRTVLSYSSRGLSTFSKDLLAIPKCSLLIAKDPEDRTDLNITVHGDALPVSESDTKYARAAYLARHPDAFRVDFGDFKFLRIEPKVVRYVSGVATALLGSGEFTNEEFSKAKVDPIYQFSKPVTSHMNKDHSDDTKLIVQHVTSVPVGCQGKTLKL